MLVVNLPRHGVKALSDRRVHVFVLGSICLCVRDVGLPGLRKFDADVVQAPLSLMAVRLRHDHPAAQDRPTNPLEALVLRLDALNDGGAVGGILKLDLKGTHTEKL